MRMTAVLAIVCVTIAAALACATGGDQSRRTKEPVYIEVTNNNVQDVDVMAVSSGQSDRLGLVSTANTQTFAVPARFAIAGRLRVLVDPIGSVNAFLTDDVAVAPGDTVAVTVQSRLDTSFLTVR